MNNLNLLPRRQLIDQLFVTVFISGVSLFVVSALLILYYSLMLDSSIQQKQEQISKIEASIVQLSNERTVDPLTKDIRGFAAQVEEIKKNRRLWIPVLDQITANLPEASRLINIGVMEQNLISLSGEFASLDQIANYVELLQSSSLLEEVTVKAFSRVTADKQVNDGSSADSLSEGKPSLEKEIFNSLEEGLLEPETEGDVLLNRLQWIIDRRIVKQQFGVDVPEIDFAVPESKETESVLPGDSPFTPEEIEQARKSLDKFKAWELDDLPSAEGAKTVFYYQVTLDLRLKPPVQEK